MQLFRRAVLALSLLTASVNAMKEGQPGPFSLAVTVFLNGQEFIANPSRFPPHNTMNSESVYATLCHMAQGPLQAALNTGWARNVFTMDFCKQIFDPHLRCFSNFVFEQHQTHYSGEYLGEEYLYSNDFYMVHVLKENQESDCIQMLLRCKANYNPVD